MNEYLTYSDIAERTGIPLNTLYVWKHRGKMPAPTVDKHQPLWAGKEIEKWMQANSHTRQHS